jgi:hypothetical protein
MAIETSHVDVCQQTFPPKITSLETLTKLTVGYRKLRLKKSTLNFALIDVPTRNEISKQSSRIIHSAIRKQWKEESNGSNQHVAALSIVSNEPNSI